MLANTQATKPPKIERISVKDWKKGLVTAFDDGRTPTNGLLSSLNVMLDQDGTIRPRPSLIKYGAQPVGTILGEVFEFVKTTTGGSENWRICLQNVAGTTKAYIAKDADDWEVCDGKTYDNEASARFCQVDDKVLIMNGKDNLSYFDIPTATVIPFVALSTPGAPTVTKTNLTGTSYTYYYRVTANSSVGETAASTASSIQVGSVRDVWDASNNVKLTWSAVSGAVSYNVYMGDVSGFEFRIAVGVNALEFIDDGSAVKDVASPAPVYDSTAGPKVSRGSVINGQVFLTGDLDNPRYVRYGGTGKSVLDFSPFNGGGWVEVGRGTKEFPVKVCAFRDGRGNPGITVLCKGTNGNGKRYIFNPQSTTVGSTVITYFDVIEDNGQAGTDSPDGVVLYNDSLFYPSRDGFKTTGTKPQLQNILSTTTISETIITDIKSLNTRAMEKCVGLPFEGRIYWLLPINSDENNQIWVLDLERDGAWMKPWDIAATWAHLYNDNDGVTHFLIISNNQIYELSYAQLTNDDGEAFNTNASSGLIKFSEDGMEWAKVIDVTFFFQRPRGNISLLVAGRTEDIALTTVGAMSDDTTASQSVAGWGEAGWGELGWSETAAVPTNRSDQNKPLVIEVDEELQWVAWDLTTTGAGVDYRLSDVVIRFVRIGVKDLT